MFGIFHAGRGFAESRSAFRPGLATMLEADPRTTELLAGVAAFSGLDDTEIRDLLNIAVRKKFNRNQPVFAVDQTARQIFIVESGSFILNLRGRKFKSFKPGDLFGEVGIINEHVRTGTIRALEESVLISIDGDRIYDERRLNPATALKITREFARMVTFYLRSQEQISTRELVEQGENELVEFKSSLRWNARSGNNDHLTEQAIMRTLAAFLNTRGGTLLVGVRDDGRILGIGRDRFENSDKMLLHLTRLIKQRISPLHMRFIHFAIEDLDRQQVLRVDVDPATLPAYFTDSNNHECFCVRTGPSTTHLQVSKIYDYIQMRFDRAESGADGAGRARSGA